MSPSDDRSIDDSSGGMDACAIVRGFMGCRIFPFEIGVVVTNLEDESRRSWSKEEKKKKNDMRYQKEKK